MALIKCPECGSYPVSDKAVACPNCGYPIREYVESQIKTNKHEKNEVDLKEETIDNCANESKPQNKTGDQTSKDVNKVTAMSESYTILGHKVSFNQKQAEYINFRYVFELAAVECHTRINEMYSSKNLGDVIVSATELMDHVMSNLVTETVRILYNSGAMISSDEFVSKHYTTAFNYNNMISEVVEKYAEITNEKEALSQYRSLQQASRSRFVGGGFGVKGAIKGAVTAGAMNAGLDFARSFGDNRKKREDDAYINKKIAELKSSDFCRDRIINGAYTCVLKVFDAMLDEIIERDSSVRRTFNDSTSKKAKNISSATKEFETDESRIISQYVEALNVDPYVRTPYAPLLKLCKSKKDVDSCDEIYRLCHRLGAKKIAYGVDSINDVESNYFINEFFRNSEILKSALFDSYEPEVFEAISNENIRLDKELADAGIERITTNSHISAINSYLGKCVRELDGDAYVALHNNRDEIKSLSFPDYIKYIFNEQKKAHMFSLPYENLWVSGTTYKSNTINDSDAEYYNKHLVKDESLLLLYDSGIYHFGNSGFGLSQNHFYDFSNKRIIDLNEIISFETQLNDYSLVVNITNKGKIVIPYKFSKLFGREWWDRAAEDMAKILNLFLDHYNLINKSIDENVKSDDSDIAAKINHAINEVDKSHQKPILKYINLNERLEKINVLKDGCIRFGNGSGEVYNSILTRYNEYVAKLTEEILHSDNYEYESIEAAIEYEKELKELKFSYDDYMESNVPDIISTNIGILKSAKSQRGQDLYKKYVEKYNWLKEYNKTPSGRFELKLIDELRNAFPKLKNEGGINNYNWIIWFDFDSDSTGEYELEPEEHKIFVCMMDLDEKFVITNHRIIAEKKTTLKEMMDDEYSSGKLDCVHLEDITQIVGKNNIVGAHWVNFQTKTGKYTGYVGLDGEKLATCIINALKAYNDSTYAYVFPNEEKENSNQENKENVSLEANKQMSVETSKEDTKSSPKANEIKETEESRLVCLNCGREINSNVKFCNYCGKNPKIKYIVCRNCGKEIPESVKFCNFCGKQQ